MDSRGRSGTIELGMSKPREERETGGEGAGRGPLFGKRDSEEVSGGLGGLAISISSLTFSRGLDRPPGAAFGDAASP